MKKIIPAHKTALSDWPGQDASNLSVERIAANLSVLLDVNTAAMSALANREVWQSQADIL